MLFLLWLVFAINFILDKTLFCVTMKSLQVQYNETSDNRCDSRRTCLPMVPMSSDRRWRRSTSSDNLCPMESSTDHGGCSCSELMGM
ncbi:hypothetical protein BP00DRAFT_14410 [Aspergillus indologenus CBS 114.80]|uniref:Secreted protein n=1 Tax=Aspergillus indologenus CBS 114.80 TaxID=1450541 RepID=A0A2V5I187_9EURO|nr:hypothetical protein BP00DRAFT_14410 [Aspergillus indologenus CBS 114.80]